MAKGSEMNIESIYIYPVKSLRGISVDSGTLTKHGFPYDRSFALLHVHDENGNKTYKNMTIASHNEMCRFFPSINYAKDGDSDKSTMTITHHPLNGGDTQSIEIPLSPDVSQLEQVDVLMHLSPTQAYKMDAKFNDWFSSCFGYETILVYISDNLREVRMSSTSYKDAANGQNGQSTGWLSSITSKATELVMGTEPEEVSAIRFSDVAPYLFVSSKSMESVHPRLPDGEEFDITKFRPNVIVSGAQNPWDEDFWSELTIGTNTKIEAEHNCGRCRSINVDYNTGAQGTGEAGTMLKKLMRDRRVDKGTKWSPVFGRYCFLNPDSEGREIKVGQEVRVTRQNKDHTAFDWKGLSTLPGGGRD